jgi:DNA-binding NtrC family response regulator
MSRKTVLVAEDEPGILDILAVALRSRGFEVLKAESVNEAKRISDSHGGDIHLLIANHRLHDGVGREVAEHMQSRRPGLKVIHTSGYGLEELAQTNTITPGAEFLQKPFLPSDIIRVVTDLLGEPDQTRTA